MKWKILIFSSLLLSAAASILIYYCIFRVAKEGIDEYYSGQDTTITIHNGKPDTVIVKKSKPNWLK